MTRSGLFGRRSRMVPRVGWSAGDRTKLREHKFTLVHLGPRVLRTETAVVAAITLLKARLGWA